MKLFRLSWIYCSKNNMFAVEQILSYSPDLSKFNSNNGKSSLFQVAPTINEDDLLSIIQRMERCGFDSSGMKVVGFIGCKKNVLEYIFANTILTSESIGN